MSGVPQRLKKQADALEIKLGECAPLPIISHVQQRGVCSHLTMHNTDGGTQTTVTQETPGIDPWSLQPVSLPVIKTTDAESPVVSHIPLLWSSINDSHIQPLHMKSEVWVYY